jgi:hypothetical protein
VIGIENEDLIDRAGKDRIDFIILAGHREAHVQEIRGIIELVLWINERLAKRIIRPLALPSCGLEFPVVDCGDEEEAQGETAAAISVTVSDDFEALEHCDDVLARHPLEMARFWALSLADNGFFLLRFFGIAVLACTLCKP